MADTNTCEVETKNEVVVAKSKNELAKHLAKEIYALTKEKGDDDFMVAISGGSLPKIMSEGLSELSDIDFTKWKVFFADERFVSLDHTDSNFKGAKDALFDKMKIPRANIFTIDSTVSLSECADDYEKQILKYSMKSKKTRNSLPKFDLILLGMGPDGHTCSLFPGHKLLDEKKKLVTFLDDSPKPPPSRVTLTYPVLNNADNVFFVAAGASKQEALNKILGSTKSTKAEPILPAGRVKPQYGRLIWFLDSDAAKRLD